MGYCTDQTLIKDFREITMYGTVVVYCDAVDIIFSMTSVPRPIPAFQYCMLKVEKGMVNEVMHTTMPIERC